MDEAYKSKENCKGIEGLVNEANAHGIDQDLSDKVRAVAAIAEYQRMSHYGIADFGNAKAFAGALSRNDNTAKLDEIIDDIYSSDHFLLKRAGRTFGELAAKQKN